MASISMTDEELDRLYNDVLQGYTYEPEYDQSSDSVHRTPRSKKDIRRLPPTPTAMPEPQHYPANYFTDPPVPKPPSRSSGNSAGRLPASPRDTDQLNGYHNHADTRPHNGRTHSYNTTSSSSIHSGQSRSSAGYPYDTPGTSGQFSRASSNSAPIPDHRQPLDYPYDAQPNGSTHLGRNTSAGTSSLRHQVLVESPGFNEVQRSTSYLQNGGRRDSDLAPESDVDWGIEGISEPGEDEFANFALLSHIAVRLRDRIPRGTHVKESIPYPRAFTGKDIVTTIYDQIARQQLINYGISAERWPALAIARSLQSQLFFYEVEWGDRPLQDSVEDVYMFLDDQEESSSSNREQEELPTGVATMLTRCYSPSCGDGGECYSPSCHNNKNARAVKKPSVTVSESVSEPTGEWGAGIPANILDQLTAGEKRRQTIIHKMITKEEIYVQDLDAVETLFIRPLRTANVIPAVTLDAFMEEIFGNFLDLRACAHTFLESLSVRQREESPIIHRIADVFYNAMHTLRRPYPIYAAQLPAAEKRLKDEIENNPEFRLWLEERYRLVPKSQASRCLTLKHFLTRPSEHMGKYLVLLQALQKETVEDNFDPDRAKERENLQKAIDTSHKLGMLAQLRTWQKDMMRNEPYKSWQWPNVVGEEERNKVQKDKIQYKWNLQTWDFIANEMEYVRDLQLWINLFLKPIRESNPPVIPKERLEVFIYEVFYNIEELLAHHQRLLNKFFELQASEFPKMRSVVSTLFDAAFNFHDAYMNYNPHYPIAEYKMKEEIANNPAFKAFVDDVSRHPEVKKVGWSTLLIRPITRLPRYDLLLAELVKTASAGHEDQDTLSQTRELITSLAKETQPGVASAQQKVKLWQYNADLVFKPGEAIDMDLLNENRSLIYTGKLLRQPDTGLEWNGWTELTVLLFDNYLVMTKAKDKEGVTKYQVSRRPIPLDLLTITNFTDPPIQRGTGIIRALRGGGGDRHNNSGESTPIPGLSPEATNDSRVVYPCNFHHNGRHGGLYTVYAESAQSRLEWKQKLEEAMGLRKAVQENNKVFEVETLSADTFVVPSAMTTTPTPSWNQETQFTGKVTCSVPFNTADGRGLVAIGCAEGVWIGFRHDSKSMRRVLHLKMVTQCAMLSDFGIFLVLADKSLFAYHIEALVPSHPHGTHNTQPQKLNGNKDVHFFSVGTLQGRTLVIYMKKKGLDSVFRVLEPVLDKITERTRAQPSFGSRILNIRQPRSEWFRIYRDFFLPSESYDLVFLKVRIAILCTKGFEIMNLVDFQSVTIPQRDDPSMERVARRCESCKPLNMFRSADDEFLLCYDEFGLYVDRHGYPRREAKTVEWEGTAEKAALHGKYVLLFDSRFIEVRHIKTGRLAQIIPGNDVRCLWDGRGVNSSAGSEQDDSQEPRVHGVYNAVDVPQTGPNRASRPITQHVFELLPTVPLYEEGQTTAASIVDYSSHSESSPPHSPPVNPMYYQ